jgi:hypothetical protein
MAITSTPIALTAGEKVDELGAVSAAASDAARTLQR